MLGRKRLSGPRAPQPGHNRRDLDVYRTLARQHGGNLGVSTAVLNGGTNAENDTAHIVGDSQA